ncbi:MAG: antirestriction protein [Rhodospirillales bacterium 20-58-10]|nr:MAG: antirestriction protein [Rhodospirillales bacterium 20-58-10]
MKDKGEIRDLYQTITDKIVETLELDGTRPWFKPWSGGSLAERVSMPLRSTGEAYRGINVISLWMAATAAGYQSAHWMTFKQALEFGGNVRKGEKGSLVVYANNIIKTETDSKTGEDIEKQIPFLKGYTVFNADQCDGLPARFYVKPEPLPTTAAERIAHAEAFFEATGASFRHGGNRAFFSPALDFIQLPPFEAFKDAESYTATKAHEFIHWTGHESRLNRDLRNRFGTEDYAKEELVAELGSAFVCADLAITPEVQPNHAAYIASWLKALKDDKRLIFKAAALAQKAVDHLHSYQPQVTAENGSEAEPTRPVSRAVHTPALVS